MMIQQTNQRGERYFSNTADEILKVVVMSAWRCPRKEISLKYLGKKRFILSGRPYDRNGDWTLGENRHLPDFVQFPVSNEWVSKLLDRIEGARIPIYFFSKKR